MLQKISRGRIYVLLADNGSRSLIKVGVTKEGIKKRISKLQTGCPFKIYPILRIEVPVAEMLTHEKTLHEALQKFKSNGEWFRFNQQCHEELTFHACVLAHRHNLEIYNFPEQSRHLDPDYDGKIVNYGYIINTHFWNRYKKVTGRFYYEDRRDQILKEEEEKKERKNSKQRN